MRTLVLAVIASGCVSFKSVNATATLGDRVAARGRTLDGMGAWCRAGVALGTQSETECVKLDGDTPRLRLAAMRLGAWARALRDLANDTHAVSIEDDVTAATENLAGVVWPSGAGAAGEVGVALNALFKAATAGYRQRTLATAVLDADAQVGVVVAYLRGIVKLETKTIDALLDVTTTAGGLVAGAPPDAQAERAGLLALAWRLREDRASLLAYDHALACFREAHGKLAKAGANLVPRDGEVYQEIIDAAKREHGADK